METTLGQRVEIILNHFNLTKSELARITGVTPTNISDILSGKSKNPQRTFYVDISKKLNISLEWLMTGEGNMIKSDYLKENTGDNSEQIIKDLLYKNLLLEMQLGKPCELMTESSVCSALEQISLVTA
ncbi:MAG: helix-turn-helix domain-containing protein [Flavobacterium sp.]|jgi:transcriptional regulator with XRE-family HTH domain|nr:helix-turn-helix domain-containing protein [Flavobacterium sp.]MCU0470243.1 helix-turn-helix domain-containing protein [Arcicella sp.]